MSNEEIIGCVCGFKCVKSQLYKTDGKCPKCNKLLRKDIKEQMQEIV